jgi:hypothetical protein
MLSLITIVMSWTSGPTPTGKIFSPKIRRLSEFSEDSIADQPRLQSF